MKSVRPKNKTLREKRRKQKHALITSFLILFIVIDLLWILHDDIFKVQNVQIKGNQTLLTTDILSIVQEDLDQKIMWLIPRDNLLFLNTKRINRVIENSFPRVYETRSLIKNGDILEVSIEEREPHSLWCRNDQYEIFSDEECYFADQRGYIYSRAPYFSEGFFQKIYTTIDVLSIGNEVMGKEEFDDFFAFTDFLKKQYDINLSRVFMGDSSVVYLYFNTFQGVSLEQNPYIVYRQNGTNYTDVKKQLALLIKDQEFLRLFRDRPEDLESFDFKISDQIRYKFKIKKENETTIQENN